MICLPPGVAPRLVALGAVLATLACGSESEPRLSGLPCELPSSVRTSSLDTVSIAGEPMCGVEFREVVRLAGSVDEPLPNFPVAMRPDGGYLTGTYDPGHLALWSADGALERVIGRGKGSGPGEFENAHEIFFRGDTVIVFDSRGRMHRYLSTGEFVDHILTPGPNRGGVLPDGTPIVSLRDEQRLATLEPRGAEPFGPPRRESRVSRYTEFAVTPDRIWEIEHQYLYELRHYEISNPGHVQTLQRSVGWFPRPTEEELSESMVLVNVVRDIAVGPSGLTWATLQVVDEDGRPLPELGSPTPVTIRPDEYWEYLDGRVEAFMPDGTLVASEVFDDPWATPQPINGGRWYLQDRDEALPTIAILEPRLVAVAR